MVCWWERKKSKRRRLLIFFQMNAFILVRNTFRKLKLPFLFSIKKAFHYDGISFDLKSFRVRRCVDGCMCQTFFLTLLNCCVLCVSNVWNTLEIHIRIVCMATEFAPATSHCSCMYIQWENIRYARRPIFTSTITKYKCMRLVYTLPNCMAQRIIMDIKRTRTNTRIQYSSTTKISSSSS